MNTNLKKFHQSDSVSFFVNTSYDETYSIVLNFVKSDNSIKKIFTPVRKSGNIAFFELTSEDTEDLQNGDYVIFIVASKEEFKKTTKLNTVKVLPSVDANCVVIETHNQKMARILKEVIERRATSDYSSYSIGNKQITKMSPEALLKWKSYYDNLVEIEENTNNSENGELYKNNDIYILWQGMI